VLKDPRPGIPHANTIRYVGQTINPEGRYRGHLGDAKHRRDEREKWLYELSEESVFPSMSIIDETTGKYANALEMSWLRFLRREGYNMTNSPAPLVRKEPYRDPYFQERLRYSIRAINSVESSRSVVVKLPIRLTEALRSIITRIEHKANVLEIPIDISVSDVMAIVVEGYLEDMNSDVETALLDHFATLSRWDKDSVEFQKKIRRIV
jgi:hypothetical protein